MILHITNDYSSSTVYKNLIGKLDGQGLAQTIYTPVKTSQSIGKNKIPLKNERSSIIYSNILNKHLDRILFPRKINKIFIDIQSKVDIDNISCIHAHTWYSDGAVALKLHLKYKIPYIIAVRSTDLNVFWKLPHLHKQGLEIVKHAKKIIFINPSYKTTFLESKSIKKRYSSLHQKTTVIPNGIDEFWINNLEPRKNKINANINIIYVGTFLKRKNILNLILAVEELIKKDVDCTLNLVGVGGSEEEKILKHSANNPAIKFHGKVVDKTDLKDLYNQSDIFAMPSLNETFGLVYGEALSQGIPVLYTKNEGIDGVFDENIGVGINPNSVQEITTGLLELITNYKQYDFDPKEICARLDWGKIAVKYHEIYEQLITK